MKEYLILFAQAHPNFRQAELESLASINKISVDLSHHDETKPFLKISLNNDDEAKQLISRSILTRAIYELWAEGTTYEELHEQIKENCQDYIEIYSHCSFKFQFEGYKGKQTNSSKVKTIESFKYLDFKGKIDLKNADETFTVLEDYEVIQEGKSKKPIYIWFGRQVELSERTKNNLVEVFDLKKRGYIGTTSFEAELSLVTCNLAQVQKGSIVYDPFAGTGSFMVTAAYFGGVAIGSDIDVRMLNGKNGPQNIKTNFKDYGLYSQFLDILTMDFTHNALRDDFVIDTIVCDPPYGVREGLRVLGAKDEEKAAGREHNIVEGEIAHLRRDFVAPKKPYELSDMLHDLLEFASKRLPIGGRLAFWMPTADDDFNDTIIPQHQNLKLNFNLVQNFNKWSRRLLVYIKMDESYIGETTDGLKELNIKNFRERYFKKFSEQSR
ncbi:hypothetical protein KGF54_003686 [Candida jiufengensis]|uniref:uncharacterized protein n=1 Tax=Candida jiufengensis TaxID=497108 RepID=UPI0022256BB3|nr:uncharacterized protein KGF54_003686 [Candida jiufengensis]KAI5952819.1 hypothetical protein KGF54_003686 [Candida jiufengensis]